MSQTRVWTLLIRSVKVCSPPHCSNRWGTRDSGRDTQGLKSHTKCQGQKPRLFAGSHETHDGLRPPPRSGGITKQTWAGWRATGTCTHGEGARARLTPCSMLSFARSVILEMRVSAPVERSRALDLLGRAGPAATCSPPAPEVPLQGRAWGWHQSFPRLVRAVAQPQLGRYCLSAFDSSVTPLCLSFPGCVWSMLTQRLPWQVTCSDGHTGRGGNQESRGFFRPGAPSYHQTLATLLLLLL